MPRISVSPDLGTLGPELERIARRRVADFNEMLGTATQSKAHIPESFEVRLTALPWQASADSDGTYVRLGSVVDGRIRHVIESPEATGHELTHGALARAGNQPVSVDEGLSDLGGKVFARHVGAPSGQLSTLGEELLGAGGRFRDETGLSFIRDLSDPPLRTLDEVAAHVEHALTLDRDQKWVALSGHTTGGVISYPVWEAAATVGHEAIDKVILDTLVDRLGRRLPTAMEEAYAAARAVMDAGGAWPLAQVYRTSAQTTASAMLDAAAARFGARSEPRNALAEAFGAAGFRT